MRSDIHSTVKCRFSNLKSGAVRCIVPFRLLAQIRQYHVDGRNRLSGLWAPSGGVTPEKTSKDDSHALLLRAGFLRQAYAGVFHLLPLGLRVQEKIEKLIDKHMLKLGASKVSLSSITSELLWKKSGRFDTNSNSEFLRLNARSGFGFMLSPTHEEEVTTVVASTLKSYKELPIRLYQVTRKYRDERRPRGGLLRTREFLMKDLYTFDLDDTAALETYHSVKEAYNNIFKELKIKYLVAEADSGAMGGNYSHEFHFATAVGEDNIISCNKCSYVANEELAEKGSRLRITDAPIGISCFISNDGLSLMKVYHEKRTDPESGETAGLNVHAFKKALPSLDLDFGLEEAVKNWLDNQESQSNAKTKQTFSTTHIFDGPLVSRAEELRETYADDPTVSTADITGNPKTGEPLDLTSILSGDGCPRCETGHLSVQKAVELGHTFHLGTRYSEPLGAVVAAPHAAAKDQRVPLSMGCHGIGITRMIAAVSSILADSKGLNWPRVIAPYEVVVVPRKGNEADAEVVYDALTGKADTTLDDRKHDLPWKLNDADLIGYPIVVVVGRGWTQCRKCEVQCRRLGNLKEEVAYDDLPGFVAGLLEKL